MARPPVFSFVDDQRRFLFLLLGLMTFLIIVSGGVILSLRGAIGRFSSDLERTGIIQVPPGGNVDAAMKIADDNKSEIVSVKTIDRAESAKILQNYISGGALTNYIPTLIQVRTKTTAGLDKIAKAGADAKLRFTRGRNAAPDRIVGIKIMAIAALIFAMMLAAMVACVMHSVKNVITIHRREIEILHQVGSTNGYIAGQIRAAMLAIGAKAGAAGLLAGWAVLSLVNGLSRQSRVGLLANMGMDGADWIITFALAVSLVVMTVAITRQRALQILRG